MLSEKKDGYYDAYVREQKAREKAEEMLETKIRELHDKNAQITAQQEYLIQSEKMASLGQLAAGIAHEINNPIGFALSNMNTIDEYLESLNNVIVMYKDYSSNKSEEKLNEIAKYSNDKDLDFILDDLKDVINETKDGMERVKKIVAGLKTFAHSGEPIMQDGNVNEVVRTALRLTLNELKYICEVKSDLEDLPDMRCHPDQLCQVFVNLLTNAGHAIKKGGHIKISTKMKGDEIHVSVEDDGHGISQDNLNKIFNPFFTTKPVGRGTGLGLSISYGIIESHGGWIDVQSEEGKGTTFTVKLPIKAKE